MKEDEYKKLKEKGFDNDKVDGYMKIQLLMLRALEGYNTELQEYLKEYDLYTVSIKNSLEGMEGKLNKLANKFKITQKGNNNLDFLSSYEQFYNIVDDYLTGNNIFNRNYQAVIDRGIIDDKTSKMDFFYKLDEEMNEFEKEITLSDTMTDREAEELADMINVGCNALKFCGRSPIEELEKVALKNKKRANEHRQSNK